jgi:hypothetical protein
MCKHAVNACLLPALAACILVLGHVEDSNSNNYLCEQQYALCTSAPCMPRLGDPTKAICSCDVLEGRSMATEPCDTLLPSTNADGVRTVYSTFSLDQAAQEGHALPRRDALDAVPEDALHGRSGKRGQGDLCLRSPTHPRMGHVRRRL